VDVGMFNMFGRTSQRMTSAAQQFLACGDPFMTYFDIQMLIHLVQHDIIVHGMFGERSATKSDPTQATAGQYFLASAGASSCGACTTLRSSFCASLIAL